MKKIVYALMLMFGIYSCQITERIYLHENGSVNYETEFDFSEMVGFMYDDSKKDSLRKLGQFPIDTLMKIADLENYSELGNDSISDAEREFMKSMEKMNVRMRINDTEGKMSIGLEEKSVADFNAYLQKVKMAGDKLNKEDPEAAKSLANSGMLKTMELKYDGKSFQRISGEMENLLAETDDSLAMATQQMMGMFEYKMEYHFPKRIKTSSIENATYSLDGKTMTVEVPMNELMENPEKYNFTVEFE